MRLAVIGTSNSILRGGYVDALREDARVDSLLRTGPGGSTSVILPYFGREVDFAAYDNVIIDTSVNDSAFLGWGLIRAVEIAENLDWILRRAIAAGCGPVLLCLPNRAHMGGGDAAFRVYRDAARRFGIPLLDGYVFAADYAADRGVPVAHLFSDDLHLRPEVARLLVPHLIGMCADVEWKNRPQSEGETDFRIIPASTMGLPVHSRRTSLLKADCAQLSHGDRVQVQMQANETLVAICCNVCKTFNSIVFKGETTEIIHIKTDVFGKKDFLAAARQISPAVSPKDGVVEMSLQAASGPGAEIIGLLIRRPALAG